MKKVTKYEAFDGTQFATPEKAEVYEWTLRGIKKAEYLAIVGATATAAEIETPTSVDSETFYDFITIRNKGDINIITAMAGNRMDEFFDGERLTKAAVGRCVFVMRDANYNVIEINWAKRLRKMIERTRTEDYCKAVGMIYGEA